jgi:hypothetical protein
MKAIPKTSELPGDRTEGGTAAVGDMAGSSLFLDQPHRSACRDETSG